MATDAESKLSFQRFFGWDEVDAGCKGVQARKVQVAARQLSARVNLHLHLHLHRKVESRTTILHLSIKRSFLAVGETAMQG